MKLLTCAFVLAGVASTLLASEHHGTVTFHGLPLPGAVVTAVNGDQKLTTSTDEDGAYSFRELTDGTWTVDVQLTGFVKANREIGVSASAPAAMWDLKLSAPSAPRTSAAGPAPAGGRGGPQLTPEQAKARAAQQAAAQDQAQARAAAVAATSGGGGDAVLAGSVGSGGGGISAGNAVAGNQYNGSAVFSLDNSAWDAVPFSVTGIQSQKLAYAKGRVGLAFGGPLKIPHLLKAKSGTFTFNYNLGRTRNASTANSTVPTALERTGDFSQSMVQGQPVIVYDPTTGQPFPNNKIPSFRLNQAALTMLNYYPLPNAPDPHLNYQIPLVSINNNDNLNARINETLNKNDRLSGGVGWNRGDNTNPNFLGFVDKSRFYGVNANASWSHTFSKRMVSNLNLNFSRSRNQLAPYFSTLNQNIAQQLGIQGTSSLPQDWGPPTLSFTNFTALSDGNASLSRFQNTNINYNLNYIRTKHQWNFGGNFSRNENNPFSDANGRGSFTFTGAPTVTSSGTGYDLADLLLNSPAVAAIRYGNADKYFRSWRLGLFALDNWNISKAITANFGIRWDYISPVTELYNRLANLSIGPGFSTATLVVAGQTGAVSRSLVHNELAGFSPSLGLAWRPFPKNNKTPTTVRFNYNLSHSLDAYSTIASNLSGQPPFAKVLSIASTPTTPLNLQTAFLNSPVTPNTYAIDPNYRTVGLQSMQVNISQTFPKGYYGNVGVSYLSADHLDQTSLPNSLPPGSTLPLNGPLSGYIYEESNGRLKAFQEFFSFGRNMASGFSASFFGNLAHGIDNGSLAAIGGGGSVAQNWLNLNAEKATSSLLTRFNLNGNWQYSTGQGKAGGTLLKGWKGALAKDWTFTNTVFLRAGNPLTATVAGETVTGTGITGTLRADATGLPLTAPAGSREPFNLAAFAVPAPGQWGTAGRNTIYGPWVWGLSGSMGRVFRLGERRSADLRFDATNFLNHVVISNFGTVVNGYNYGLPTGTQAMRSMTANLRFRF